LTSMLGRIISHDFRLLRADRTLHVAGGLFALLIVYGLVNGAAWVQFQNATIREVRAEQQERYAKISSAIDFAIRHGKPLPATASVTSMGDRSGSKYAILPTAPLAPLAVGESDLLPYYFRVSTQSKQNFLTNDEIENPVNLLAGRFDLAFVVLYLYPLVILALSYNLISAERESGTLAMTLAQPVSLRTLALGKALTRFCAILGISVALSVPGATLAGVDFAAPGALSELLLWIAAVAIYGAFWFAAAVLVNSFGSSSSTNAIALAGIWLFFVVLVPSLFNVAMKTAYPVPSRVEMIQAMRAATAEATARGSQLLARYFEDHPEFAEAREGPNDFAAVSLAVQEETERRVRPVMEIFDNQLSRQQRWIDRYRFLSPAIVTQSILYDLTGTGTPRYRHFLQLADRFHQQWRSYFNERVVRSQSLSAADISQLPAFPYREEPLGAVVQRTVVSLGGLAATAALVALLAVQMLRRYCVAG